MKRKARSFIQAMLAGLVAMVAATPSWAWDRDTHQHLTELAYAYLKLAGSNDCKPSQIGTPEDYQQCLASCESDPCTEECFLEHHRFPDDRCKPLALPMALGLFDSARAAQAVKFFQDFKGTPCPPHDSSEGGSQYHYDNGGCFDPLDLSNPTSAKPLRAWETARIHHECAQAPSWYRPVIGGLLGATSADMINNQEVVQQVVDLTGTIVGYHSSVVDVLSDLYTVVLFFPVITDVLRVATEFLAGAGLTAGGVVTLVLGVPACALGCPVTVFFGQCDDCFADVWDTTKDIFGSIDDVIKDIDEANAFGIAKSTRTLGIGDNTSMFHFMGVTSDFDDIDGWWPKYALTGLRDWKTAGIGIYDQLELDYKLFGARVLYPPSQRALRNYQPQSVDDGMQATSERLPSYWNHAGMLEYIFPPIDNLAYYWWHKWLQDRITNTNTNTGVFTSSYGLLPLGAVLHAVQDITQPLHARSISLPGHADYEHLIAGNLDPASKILHSPYVSDLDPCRAVSLNPCPPEEKCWADLLVDLNISSEEERFLRNIADWMVRIADPGTESGAVGEGGVLNIRPLMHFLSDHTFNADTTKEFAAQTALPMAVAATTWVLLEASRLDLKPYQDELGLNLSEFERKGPVPPIDGENAVGTASAALGSDIPPGFDAEHPEWICAASAPRSKAAAEGYLRGTVTGQQLMVAVFSEKTRCDLQALGLPAPPPAELDTLAAFTVGQYKAFTRALSHGSIPQLDQELACNALSMGGALFPPQVRARHAARCAGTLDTDQDGVPDQNDQCFTPRDLLARYTVKPNGCIFDHEAFPELQVEPFIPGTIRTRIQP